MVGTTIYNRRYGHRVSDELNLKSVTFVFCRGVYIYTPRLSTKIKGGVYIKTIKEISDKYGYPETLVLHSIVTELCAKIELHYSLREKERCEDVTIRLKKVLEEYNIKTESTFGGSRVSIGNIKSNRGTSESVEQTVRQYTKRGEYNKCIDLIFLNYLLNIELPEKDYGEFIEDWLDVVGEY